MEKTNNPLRNPFLERIDDYTLELLLDYHYGVLMNTSDLNKRSVFNELYEALCIEKNFRKSGNIFS